MVMAVYKLHLQLIVNIRNIQDYSGKILVITSLHFRRKNMCVLSSIFPGKEIITSIYNGYLPGTSFGR